MKTFHLFAGAGGGIWADLILGHTPSWALEIDEGRVRMLENSFPRLKVIHKCIDEFDGKPYEGSVDIVCAGVPCPKWSIARRTVGKDPRDLVDQTARVISEIKPQWVFLECVPGFVREHARIRRSLPGYTLSRPLITSASSVGAPFMRKRYWAAARADEYGQPVMPVYDEAPCLPAPLQDFWQVRPRRDDVANGVAPGVVAALGDGQIPIQAASAWIMLGLPYEKVR